MTTPQTGITAAARPQPNARPGERTRFTISTGIHPAKMGWQLSGPAGWHLDLLIASLAGADAQIEVLQAGKSYRIAGVQAEQMQRLAAQIKEALPGHELKPHSEGPGASVSFPDDSPRPHRQRVAKVFGHGSHSFVARAIDLGLSVCGAGSGRWEIRGSNAQLRQWMSQHAGASEEALKAHRLDAGSDQAEEPPVQRMEIVSMPDRKTTTEVERDRATGNIVSSTQLERDA